MYQSAVCMNRYYLYSRQVIYGNEVKNIFEYCIVPVLDIGGLTRLFPFNSFYPQNQIRQQNINSKSKTSFLRFHVIPSSPSFKFLISFMLHTLKSYTYSRDLTVKCLQNKNKKESLQFKLLCRDARSQSLWHFWTYVSTRTHSDFFVRWRRIFFAVTWQSSSLKCIFLVVPLAPHSTTCFQSILTGCTYNPFSAQQK